MSNPIDCRCGKFKNEQLKVESITQRDEKPGKKRTCLLILQFTEHQQRPRVVSSELSCYRQSRNIRKKSTTTRRFCHRTCCRTKKKCETSERNNKKSLAALLKELKVCGWEKTHRITRTTAWAMENLLSTMRRLWQHDRKFNFKWNFQSKSNEECLLVSMAQDDSFRSELRGSGEKVWKISENFTRNSFSSKTCQMNCFKLKWHDEGKLWSMREILLVCGFLCSIMCLINDNRLLNIQVLGETRSKKSSRTRNN